MRDMEPKTYKFSFSKCFDDDCDIDLSRCKSHKRERNKSDAPVFIAYTVDKIIKVKNKETGEDEDIALTSWYLS